MNRLTKLLGIGFGLERILPGDRSKDLMKGWRPLMDATALPSLDDLGDMYMRYAVGTDREGVERFTRTQPEWRATVDLEVDGLGMICIMFELSAGTLMLAFPPATSRFQPILGFVMGEVDPHEYSALVRLLIDEFERRFMPSVAHAGELITAHVTEHRTEEEDQ